jgi:hypothetical protein
MMRDKIMPFGREARRASYTGALLHAVSAEIERELKRLSIAPEDFFGDLRQVSRTEIWSLRAMQLIDHVPLLDAERDLVLGRDFNLSRKPALNDMLDIAALSMAIIYCDVVITERFWVEIAERSGLSRRYNTIMLSDVAELDHYLN